VGVGGFSSHSRIGVREIFIFPAFSLVRVSRKDTLNEFETAIKMPPHSEHRLGNHVDISRYVYKRINNNWILIDLLNRNNNKDKKNLKKRFRI
jgi:hypothetical protein